VDSELVETAEAIARRAHDGQVDKAGAAYIDHPRRVAERAAVIAGPEVRADAAAAAWLHDVVEDTSITLDELAAAGMPPRVLEAVELVTKVEGMSVEQYFARIRGHAVARVVKLADLIDNTDPARIRKLDSKTRDRLSGKYARSMQLLLGVGDV
jgi:(p)ppGpp synthase/HD superfamily hydrolase